MSRIAGQTMELLGSAGVRLAPVHPVHPQAAAMVTLRGTSISERISDPFLRTILNESFPSDGSGSCDKDIAKRNGFEGSRDCNRPVKGRDLLTFMSYDEFKSVNVGVARSWIHANEE